MSKEAMVLKSDEAGRVQTPVARQVELVREFERSGLSGPRFAELAGVKYQTFATWRRRHGAQGPAREQCKPVFLVVTTARTEVATTTLEIALPGGAQVCRLKTKVHRGRWSLARRLSGEKARRNAVIGS